MLSYLFIHYIRILMISRGKSDVYLWITTSLIAVQLLLVLLCYTKGMIFMVSAYTEQLCFGFLFGKFLPIAKSLFAYTMCYRRHYTLYVYLGSNYNCSLFCHKRYSKSHSSLINTNNIGYCCLFYYYETIRF